MADYVTKRGRGFTSQGVGGSDLQAGGGGGKWNLVKDYVTKRGRGFTSQGVGGG